MLHSTFVGSGDRIVDNFLTRRRSSNRLVDDFLGGLVKKELGVNIDDGFTPLYQVLPAKRTVVSDLKAASQAFEAAIIRDRLRQYGGNRAQAAESLGLPKRTLAHKCLKYQVTDL